MNLSVETKGRRLEVCGGTVLVGREVVANTAALLLLQAHKCADKNNKTGISGRKVVSWDRPPGPQAGLALVALAWCRRRGYFQSGKECPL
jgi:hypothetical protein